MRIKVNIKAKVDTIKEEEDKVIIQVLVLHLVAQIVPVDLDEIFKLN